MDVGAARLADVGAFTGANVARGAFAPVALLGPASAPVAPTLAARAESIASSRASAAAAARAAKPPGNAAAASDSAARASAPASATRATRVAHKS